MKEIVNKWNYPSTDECFSLLPLKPHRSSKV